MAWQVLAMWLIVGSTIVWFVRDEQRRRAALLNRQALHFANQPYVRRPSKAQPQPEPLPPAPVPRGLTRVDRAFFKRYLQA